MEPAIIIDFDHCLRGKDNKPETWCLTIINMFMETHCVFLFSEVPADSHSEVVSWLQEKCGISSPNVSVLPFRPDVGVIENRLMIYKEVIKPFFDVQLILDADPQGVRLWQDLGLKCFRFEAV